ncbi:MAG: ABC transporter ATP-binding protein, partial [Desulfobacterales bacterium]|nr:ABC transporter ATP-binding protein [Desulfobacterales bacterium]
MTPVLQILELSVTHGSSPAAVQALDRISFDVNPGEIFGLVGGSGAGKSSLCHVLAGNTAPRAQISGRALFQDMDLVRLAPAAFSHLYTRRLALVPQGTASLNPLLTVGGHVRETLKQAEPGRRVLNESVGEVLTRFNLSPELAGSFPFQLSGGMQQRLLLALAFCGAPDLVLCDEPTTGLDPALKSDFLGFLKRMVKEENTAVLLVTHDLVAAHSVCDRVGVLRRGKLQEVLPGHRLFNAPGRSYTRALVRSLPGRGMASPVPRFEATASGAPRLAVKGLNFSLGSGWLKRRRKPILKDLRFDLYPGEILGIVGPSGVGKSTLARLIMGRARPHSGTIALDGRDIFSLGKGERKDFHCRVQMVGQHSDTALNPYGRVRDAVKEIFRVEGRRAHARVTDGRIQGILAGVGLGPEYLDRRPAQLSGGERQRVVIGRILALNPRLIVADEAVTGLDPLTRSRIIPLMTRAVAKEGASMIFISHD